MLPLYVYNSADRRLRLENVAALPSTGDLLACDGGPYRVTAVYHHVGARGPVACVEPASSEPRPVIPLGQR